MANLLNLFTPKKKEHVAQIGGVMGDFDAEFGETLEDEHKGPQILGSITFNLPDFAPEVTEVADSFYGLFQEDILGKKVAEPIMPEDPKVQRETASLTRKHNQALAEASQRRSVQRQEELMKDALRMGVNIIDVQIKVQPHTNPIQLQREQDRMAELGISDIMAAADKVEETDQKVKDAEQAQAAAEVKGPEIVVDQNAAPEGGTGRGSQNISPIAGAG